MPTLFEIQTVTRQFFRVESELSVLKAMVRELVLGNAPPPPNAPLTVEQPATEAPEPRVPQKGDLLNLHGEPVHFDGKHWVKGPTPANGTLNVPDARSTVTDRTVGLSGEG